MGVASRTIDPNAHSQKFESIKKQLRKILSGFSEKTVTDKFGNLQIVFSDEYVTVVLVSLGREKKNLLTYWLLEKN